MRPSLAAISALAAFRYFWHLTINGYANTDSRRPRSPRPKAALVALGRTAALVALLLAWCVLVIRPRPIARVAEAPYVAWRPSSTG